MTMPFASTIYGISQYGTSLYGFGIPSGYIVDPFTATPFNYEVINLGWVQCSNPIAEFRLLRNRFGYPVDENDGELLLDTEVWPGNAFADTDIIPGTYHYYGIYLLVQQGEIFTWIRAGLAACLAPGDFASENYLFELIPLSMRDIGQVELTADATGNLFLYQFMQVIGWGLDYLRTQYSLALQANNPQVIPLNSLMNLAGTIGYPFEPEIAAGVMRKGIANAAHVATERGTTLGIINEVNILTGWEIIPTIGYNQMLENDHGYFISPVDNYLPWNSTVSYDAGEYVTVGSYVYVSNLGSNLNHTVNTGGNNTWWNVVLDTDNTTTLANPVTGGINIWESRYTAASGQVAPSNTCREGVGIANPISTDFQRCGVRVYNTGGSSQSCELRTPARTTVDQSNLSSDPDPQQVILDGVPVTYLIPSEAWQGNTELETNAIVEYNGQPFIALRPSTGAVPTTNTNVPSNEWQPIGLDQRIAIMMSAYVSQSLTTGTNYQCPVTPYVVWYDQWGRYIAKVTARNALAQINDVVVATTANIVGTPAANTLTATAHAAFPAQDGVTLNTIGQTILLQSQTTTTQNGIYQLSTVGSGSVSWVLTRTTANTAYPGLAVQADQGTVNGGLTFYCQNTSTPTFGTTAITFSATALPATLQPPGLIFDSFTQGWGTSISGSATDISGLTWTAQAGGMTMTAFGNGTVSPTTMGTRSESLISSGLSNCALGVTFASGPDSGNSQALVFRWTSDSNYWRADQYTLSKLVAGVWTVLAAHTTQFLPGDRMNVTLNGSVITVFRNNVQVSTATDAFNSTATSHGILYEQTTPSNYPTFSRQTATSTRKRVGSGAGRRRFTPENGEGLLGEAKPKPARKSRKKT